MVGRQRPVTAGGIIFVTLEDETGPVNVIVRPGLREVEEQRNALLRGRLLAVEGQWQRDQEHDGAECDHQQKENCRRIGATVAAVGHLNILLLDLCHGGAPQMTGG